MFVILLLVYQTIENHSQAILREVLLFEQNLRNNALTILCSWVSGIESEVPLCQSPNSFLITRIFCVQNLMNHRGSGSTSDIRTGNFISVSCYQLSVEFIAFGINGYVTTLIPFPRKVISILLLKWKNHNLHFFNQALINIFSYQ